MPAISQKKKDKISEQILHHLFEISPQAVHTNKIAETIARDEEFTKAIMIDLLKKFLVVLVDKNPQGIKYEKRQRWRLSQQAYDAYKKHQNNQNNTINPLTEEEI